MDPDNDLRGDIESAFNGSDPGETVVDEPVTQTGEESPPTPPAEGEGTQRDALGRFVKKETQPAEGTPAAAAPGKTPRKDDVSGALSGTPPITPAPTPPTTLQPPAGWSPAVREHWANLPQPVQEYVLQREQQMQRWANDTAPLRNAGEAFINAVQPYRMAIQAEGVDPITAVTNLLQVGQTLRFGTPGEKASTIAHIVKAYGVDIPALDAALVGVAPPEGTPQINVQAEVQRALAPIMQSWQQRQQAEAYQTTEEARQELIEFANDPKHEFIGDVRIIMADLIEVGEKNGYKLPLQDAYDRACALHPEVSKVIMARQQGVNAQKLTQNAQRAKAAAVGVKGAAPVGNPNGAEPSSLRESIEAAIDAHSRV